MSPLDEEMIQRKIAVIIENLKALKMIKDMRGEDYMQICTSEKPEKDCCKN